jgi:hypothetical protein
VVPNKTLEEILYIGMSYEQELHHNHDDLRKPIAIEK